MRSVARTGLARASYLAVLAAGFIAMLVANLPGHMTLDSVLELYEGRYRIRQSWAPSFYAWVLGVFDAVLHGTGLYVAVSAAMLVAALASLTWLRRSANGWVVAAAALLVVSPIFVIYQAMVWKDVLFANCAIVGLVALAWALGRPRRDAAWAGLLATALVLLAAAALLRQNGVLVGVCAAAALGFTQAAGRVRRGLVWGVGALASIVLVSHGMNLATQPGGPGSGDGMAEGMRILQGYDLIGAITLDPDFPLANVTDSDPDAAAVLRRLGPRYYSAERTDRTDGQPQIAQALASLDDDAMAADWRALVLQHTGLYLRERAAVFRWVFLTPDVDRCVPVCLGIQGPDNVLAELGLKWRWSDQDDRLLDYGRAFLQTPLFSHLFYALLALGVVLVLLVRREPADVAVIALMLSALAFAASFFAISIACDYRYLYFLDLAAMTGLLYVAVDPPVFVSGRGSRRAPGPPRR
jgi:hypothetical protein